MNELTPPQQSITPTPQHNQLARRPVEIKYWDHFPHDIGGRLASRRRLAVKEVLDDFDFFISIEGASVHTVVAQWHKGVCACPCVVLTD